MFTDYYSLLDISEFSNDDEIKAGYRNQVLKWHPDKNRNSDTTQRMQEINEAYLILKDKKAREKYNIEYQKFKKFRNEVEVKSDTYSNKEREDSNFSSETEHTYSKYTVTDDVLKKWMENARKQSVDIAKQAIKDFSGMVSTGSSAVVSTFSDGILGFILIGIILFIISLFRACD